MVWLIRSSTNLCFTRWCHFTRIKCCMPMHQYVHKSKLYNYKYNRSVLMNDNYSLRQNQERSGTNKGWCHTTIEPKPTIRRVSSCVWVIWVDFVKLDLHQVIGIVETQLLVTGYFLWEEWGGGRTRSWRNRSRQLIVTNKQKTCQSCLLTSTRSHPIIELYIIMYSQKCEQGVLRTGKP